MNTNMTIASTNTSHWEERLRSCAAEQCGLVAKRQLPRLDCTNDHWWQARRNGRWDLLSSRVIRLRGVPETAEQRALAGVLDAGPGAALHWQSALAWYGLANFDLRTIHVSRVKGVSGAPTTLARLHVLRDLRAHDILIVRGVPTESALRAIWSEAARFSPEPLFEWGCQVVGRLLDDANVRGLCTWAGLHEMVDDIHQRGRAGSTIMRELAKARPPGSSPTESRNEDQFEKILANAGRRPLRRQVVVGGHEPIGRVDQRDDGLPLVVEVNSLAFHSSPSDQRADELRYQQCNDAGLTVAVVWEPDVWSRAAAVVKTVDEGRDMARAGDFGVIHSPGCPWPYDQSRQVIWHPSVDAHGPTIRR